MFKPGDILKVIDPFISSICPIGSIVECVEFLDGFVYFKDPTSSTSDVIHWKSHRFIRASAIIEEYEEISNRIP